MVDINLTYASFVDRSDAGLTCAMLTFTDQTLVLPLLLLTLCTRHCKCPFCSRHRASDGDRTGCWLVLSVDKSRRHVVLSRRCVSTSAGDSRRQPVRADVSR